MRRQRVPAPTKLINGKKFRLHCTRTVVPPVYEQTRLEAKGYETVLEHSGGVYKLWKDVKRE